MKKRNYNILYLYYINLIQSKRYFEIIKQFDFVKKIILNEEQNNSLLFLKKINLRNNDDKINLVSTKNNDDIEKSVVSYFRNIIRNEGVSKNDYLIFQNLNEEIKDKI